MEIIGIINNITDLIKEYHEKQYTDERFDIQEALLNT